MTARVNARNVVGMRNKVLTATAILVGISAVAQQIINIVF